MDIVECPYPDFKYQHISKYGKFYFDNESDNIDFKCQIPVHGDITFYSDRDRKLLKTKLEKGRIIDRHGNSMYMSDSGVVKEYRELNPKKDKHIIKKKIEFKKKEIRYQYRKNGDIELHRANCMQRVGILQLPRVYNDKGDLAKVTQRMYHKKDAVYHVVTIDPSWFKSQSVVYYDDPFTVTSTAHFDGGTKYRVQTHTDFPDHITDSTVPGVAPGKLKDQFGSRYYENFDGMTWGQSLNGYNGWIADESDGGSIKHNRWNYHNYCNDNSAIIFETNTPGSANTSYAHRSIAAWDDDEEFVFFFKYNEAQTHIGPSDFHIRTYDGDPLGAGDVNAHILFHNGGTIYYWDDGDAGMTNSTETYDPNEWYRIRITHDNAGAGGNGTYRAYILGGAFTTETEVTDGAQEYEDAGGLDPAYIDFLRDPNGNEVNYYYIDSICIGGFETSGNWQSNTVEIEPQYRLYDFTVSFEDCDANDYITNIEFLIGADVIAAYSTNIDTETSPVTILDGNLTSGTFKDIEEDFTVKIYFIGTSASTPVILEMSSTFEYVGFETTTASQFDDGTGDVETYNDFRDGMTNDNYGVPPGEIHPLYGDDWDDNFEGTDDQTVGIQYRASDYTQIATTDGGTMIIASDQEYSGDHSCKFTYPTGNGLTELDAESDPVWAEGDNTYHYMLYWRCHNAGVLTPNRFEFYIRDADSRAIAVHLEFQEALDIIYTDDGGDHDSGQNYAVDTWYRIRVEMYSDSDTWEAWILGGAFTGETSLTGDAAVPYQAGTGVPGDCTWRRVTTDFEADNAEYWLDNFKLAEYVAASDWTSPTYIMEEGKFLKNTTITYSDTDADAYIDKIEWYDTNDVLLADYTTDIIATGNSPLTINNEDLTRGSFTDLDGDFYIKVYFVVVDLDTCPKLQKIGGQFTHEGQHGQIDCEVRFIGDYGKEDWLDDWAYRIPIKVNRSVIDEDLENFVVLMRLGGLSGIDESPATHIFSELAGNYQRLAVTLADGKTQCPVEVAYWDDTNDMGRLWVKIPRLRQHITDYLYLYYDSSQSNNTDYVDIQGTPVSHKVWSENYNIVHHMEDITTSTIRDSTRFSHDGVKDAANNPLEFEDTDYGYAQDFDGLNDHITMVDNDTLESDAITVEAVVRWDDLPATIQTLVAKQRQSSSNMWFYYNGTAEELHWQIGDGVTRVDREVSWSPSGAGVWYYIAATYESNGTDGTFKIFVNEVKELDTTYPNLGHWASTWEDEWIGSYRAGFYFWDGDMAEFRQSNIARSEAWMKASYYNMTDELLHFRGREDYESYFISAPGDFGTIVEGTWTDPYWRTVLSSKSNSLHTDDIWIESMTIDHISNRTPQCDLTITATESAKLISRGDIMEIIREGDVYPFYGHVETISQSTGSHSIDIHCEGMMFYCAGIPIRKQFYTGSDSGEGFFNLEHKQTDDGDQLVNALGTSPDWNFPVCAVQTLHTTEKNLNTFKDGELPENPYVSCLAAPAPRTTAIAMAFHAHGGTAHGKTGATQLNRIGLLLKRQNDALKIDGSVKLSIMSDLNGQPNTEIASCLLAGKVTADMLNLGDSSERYYCPPDGNDHEVVFNHSDFTINTDYPNAGDNRKTIILQDGQKYWIVLERNVAGQVQGMEIDWVSANTSQMSPIHTAYTDVGGTYYPWLQKCGVTDTLSSGYQRVGADENWWCGGNPVFDIEFDSDWITMVHGRDYLTERGSLNLTLEGNLVPSGMDGLCYETLTGYHTPDSKFEVIRVSHSKGIISLADGFALIARDYMRNIIETTDITTTSAWTTGDWQINDSNALATLQALATLDRVAIRIYKNNLAHPLITFEAVDKMTTGDWSDYTTTEQNLRTFKSGADCVNMKERAENARIISASASYDHNNRVTRCFVRGACDEEEIVAVRTLWDADEYTEKGILRDKCVSSDIIRTLDEAMDVADQILNDYGDAPFEGDITVVDSRYDSYKIYNSCNGVLHIVISELGLDDYFEIDSITTTWDGGNNWVNTIKLGDTTAKYRVPDLEGWSRKFLRVGFGVGGTEVEQKTFSDVMFPGGHGNWWEEQKNKSPGSDDDDADTRVIYDHRYAIVEDLDTSIDHAADPNIYMDIGTSDTDVDNDEIQGPILTKARPLCKRIVYTYKTDWVTYFAVFDRANIGLDKELHFPLTIREFALYDGDGADGDGDYINPQEDNALTRRILKPDPSGTGYANDLVDGNEIYHPEIIFTSSDRIYVFYDVFIG